MTKLQFIDFSRGTYFDISYALTSERISTHTLVCSILLVFHIGTPVFGARTTGRISTCSTCNMGKISALRRQKLNTDTEEILYASIKTCSQAVE